MPRRIINIVLTILCAMSACTQPPAPTDKPVTNGFELPPIETFDTLHWTGRLPADDPVLATVYDTKITQSMLVKQLQLAGDRSSPEEVLERMIELEILARQAFERGYYRPDVVGNAFRESMARRWVEHTFAEELRPETMPQSGIDEVYEQAKGLYDHFTRFHVVDAQILCCTSMSDQDSCYRDFFDSVAERREHLSLCFEQVKPQVDALREKLVQSQTSQEFRKLFDTWSPDFLPDALRESYQLKVAADGYLFQYNVNETYEKQFEKVRYRVFYKEIMDGVKDAWLNNNADVPVLTPVIRTPIGFHLLFIYQVDPERHLGPTNPTVQEDIRKNAFEAWRKAYFARQMSDYCESLGCEINRDGVLRLQEAEARAQAN